MRSSSPASPSPAAHHGFTSITMAVGVLALASLVGCGKDSSTGPPPPPTNDVACGVTGATSAGVVSLAVFQAATADCSNGGDVFELAPGASYLLVPEFATDGIPNVVTPFTIGAASATASVTSVSRVDAVRGAPAASANPAAALFAPASALMMPGARQASFDQSLRSQSRAALRSHAWRAGPAAARASVAAQTIPVPPVGSIRSFRVISSFSSTTTTTFKTVNARLGYVGTDILVYVDTLAAPNGLSQANLDAIGQLFDQTLYPIDLQAFGQPSDIDQNGHLIMSMSPVVNALTSSADCRTQGFVAGFFTGFDLASTSSDSNHGEVFYTIAPDPAGVSSCAHTVADIERVVPATFLHEVQHLINFSQHVVVHGGNDQEAGWLDEGLSIVAEELGSLYYEKKFPPPTGRTNPLQLFPDSSQGFIGGLLSDSYTWLLRPDTASVTLHSDSDGGLAWRGGDWALMHWLGDQMGAGFYPRLEATTLVGTTNITAASGLPFASLFSDFGLSLYTDSIPGIPRASVPQRDRFVTRNLRQMYAALFRAAGNTPDVPQVFPITTVTLSTTTLVHASMVPGTPVFYRIDVPAGSANLKMRFGSATAGVLSATLHPQVAVFRVPPGSP